MHYKIYFLGATPSDPAQPTIESMAESINSKLFFQCNIAETSATFKHKVTWKIADEAQSTTSEIGTGLNNVKVNVEAFTNVILYGKTVSFRALVQFQFLFNHCEPCYYYGNDLPEFTMVQFGTFPHMYNQYF